MSAGTSHHVHTGRKVSECVRTREEGKEIDGLLGQGKRREKRGRGGNRGRGGHTIADCCLDVLPS